MNIRSDYHIHTHFSSCCLDKANQVPEKISQTALNLGLEAIGFADHLWERSDIKPSGHYVGHGVKIIESLRKEVAAVSAPLAILTGCEADTLSPGEFTVTRKYADTLDFVLLSCSHFHLDVVAQPADRTPRGVAKHVLDFFNSAVRSALPTAIAHPFLPYGFLDMFDAIIAQISDAEFSDAFGLAAENNVAIEISAHFMDCTRDDNPTWHLDTPLRMLSLAKASGCKFTFGSDAHRLEQIALVKNLKLITDTLGLEEADMLRINARVGPH